MTAPDSKIGILSYQGDVREHAQTLRQIGVEPRLVNKAEHLDGLKGLIIPGGESTTIGHLLSHYGLDRLICEQYQNGMAIFGTCAGLILMAKRIENAKAGQPSLNLMDITASRNAFGSQIQSFEAQIPVPVLGQPDVRAVFIRAPYISEFGSEVEPLAYFEDRLILARQGRLLAAAFHPELVGETRLHKYFLEMCG